MKMKPITQIQEELINILGNVAMISVNQGDILDKECKSKAIELLKKIISELDENKNN